jgi:dihydrofolate reductase
MRRIVSSTFVSLDGVMQAPGGPAEDPTGGFAFGGWTAPYFDEALGAAMGEIFGRPFDLLLGRKTYDIFAAHWPYITDPDDAFAAMFNRITKYVASHSEPKLDWKNSQWLGKDTVAALKKLKGEDGPDLMVQGSSDLLQTLWKAGLVDEFSVLTFPLVLGKGKRLFGEGAIPAGLKLVASRTSPKGVTISTYERAGEIKPGSFGGDKPA